MKDFSQWFQQNYPSLQWNRLMPGARKRIQLRFEEKAKKKAYCQKPEIKVKKKAYNQRPDVKAKQKRYHKRWYKRNKRRF
jgi:hypothetical protein